jgi:hypothetical protein
VQIAFEAAPLRVTRPDDPRSRGPNLFELGSQLRLQAFVLERKPSGGAGGLDDRKALVQRGIVDQSGHCPAVVLDQGHCAAGIVAGQRKGAPRRIDESAPRPREGEFERRVPEGLRKRAPKPAARQWVPERHDEVADRGPFSARPQQSGEEGERDAYLNDLLKRRCRAVERAP